jgi:uncharacterized protein (TIGR03067 family)
MPPGPGAGLRCQELTPSHKMALTAPDSRKGIAMWRGCLVLSFVVLAAGFAPAPLPRHERRDSRPGNDMVGSWTDGSGDLRITHDRFNHNGHVYELRVNTTVRPKTHDLRGIAGGKAAGREYTGIYKIEGDKLTVSYNSGRTPRPTAFAGPGVGQFVEVYTRVK